MAVAEASFDVAVDALADPSGDEPRAVLTLRDDRIAVCVPQNVDAIFEWCRFGGGAATCFFLRRHRFSVSEVLMVRMVIGSV